MLQMLFLCIVGVAASPPEATESWWSRRPGVELARTHAPPPSSREEEPPPVQVKVAWDGTTGLVETGAASELSEEAPDPPGAAETPVHGFAVGDVVQILKPGTQAGTEAVVTSPDGAGGDKRPQVLRISGTKVGSFAAYKRDEMKKTGRTMQPEQIEKFRSKSPGADLPAVMQEPSKSKLPARFDRHDASDPAGFCVLDSIGIPLCCRTKLSECWKSMSVGGCQGSYGIPAKPLGGERDYCFAVHSTPGTGVEPETLKDRHKIDPSVHSPLYVVWDYFDPRNEKLHMQSDAGATSTLRGWTKWLKHICRPLFRWLNPPEDPDPQMLWCLQEGQHACEVKCRGQINDKSPDDSGELLTVDEEKGNVEYPKEARPNPSPCQPFLVTLSEHLDENAHVPVLELDSAADDYAAANPEVPEVERRQYTDGHFYVKSEFYDQFNSKQDALQAWESAPVEIKPQGLAHGAPLFLAALVLLG